MDGTNTTPTTKNSLQQTQTFIHILLHIRFYTAAIHEQSGNHKPLGISLSLSLSTVPIHREAKLTRRQSLDMENKPSERKRFPSAAAPRLRTAERHVSLQLVCVCVPGRRLARKASGNAKR